MNEKLSAYMKDNNLTDQGFGDLIGRSRMQVFRYRRNEQMPDKDTMLRILEVTKGAVDPASFYQD